MIAVIICRQLRYSFIECPVFVFCQFIDFRLKIAQHLFFRNTTDGCIFRLKADIAQIIEYREERNLRKLGDAGDEDKLLVFIICLENGKNLSINRGTCFVVRSFPGMLQWRIVFVNENGNLLASLLIRTNDYCIEAVGKLGGWLRCNAIFLL